MSEEKWCFEVCAQDRYRIEVCVLRVRSQFALSMYILKVCSQATGRQSGTSFDVLFIQAI